VDSAFVKANASLESLCEKQLTNVPAPVLQVASEVVAETPLAPPAALRASPAHHLRRVAAAHARYDHHNSGPLGRDRPQARLLSNKTHYSTADPDARISAKPGKARALTTCTVWPWRKGTLLLATFRPTLPTAATAHAPAAATYSRARFWQLTPALRDALSQHKRPQ